MIDAFRITSAVAVGYLFGGIPFGIIVWQPCAAFDGDPPRRLSVVPGTKWEVERETGLEPATFSLEG
jgi:hypothetical protein